MPQLRAMIVVWVVMMALLASTVLVSFLATGTVSLIASLAIAALKAGAVYWFFMHLRDSPLLVKLAAIVAPIWLFILTSLASSDLFTR